MSAKKTGVGFVGCGGFATGNHIPNAAKNPAMEIIGFCDLNEEQLSSLAGEYSPKYTTTDMEKIFTDADIDMVVCSTKPDFRIPVMEMAVKYGKPLFVEKPLCMTREEVEIMVPLIRKSGLPFMVGFNRPYSPFMQELRSIYREAKEGPTTIIYRIVGEAQLWPKHHYDAVMNGKESTIIHEVTHIFDLLNWLTGSVPHKVYVEGEGNTNNVITLSYPDNITAVIIAGDNASVSYPKERIEINSNYHTIVGEHFVDLSHYTDKGRVFHKLFPITLGNKGEERVESIEKVIEQLYTWRAAVTPEEIAVGYYYENFPKANKGHYEELEFFRNAVMTGGKLETGVEQGAIANIIAWTAHESWLEHTPKDLDFSWIFEVEGCLF